MIVGGFQLDHVCLQTFVSVELGCIIWSNVTFIDMTDGHELNGKVPLVYNHARLQKDLVNCLEKNWPLGSRLWYLTVNLSLSHWDPGSCGVLDCIDSWSLHPYLLYPIFLKYPHENEIFCSQTVFMRPLPPPPPWIAKDKVVQTAPLRSWRSRKYSINKGKQFGDSNISCIF